MACTKELYMPDATVQRISRARPGDEILPSRYRKKPVEIDAIRWSGTNLKEVIDFTGLHESADKWTWEEYEAVVREKGLKIFSLEGSNFIVTNGDYIIKGVKGEFYACKPDIFWMTYVRADTPHSEKAATEAQLSATAPTGFEAAAKKLEERAAIVERLERNLMSPKALYYSVEVNTLKAAAAMLRSIDSGREK